MIKIFDRYLLNLYVRSFVVCFVSLVGLYIVIDAFSNLDEFSERADGVSALLGVMLQFYSYRVSLFFDHLAGVITAIAAMFTIAWVQRTNELTPMLAAGVSVYRVFAPVFAAALAVNCLMVCNQEAVIPRIASELQRRHDDSGDQLLRGGERA